MRSCCNCRRRANAGDGPVGPGVDEINDNMADVDDDPVRFWRARTTADPDTDGFFLGLFETLAGAALRGDFNATGDGSGASDGILSGASPDGNAPSGTSFGVCTGATGFVSTIATGAPDGTGDLPHAGGLAVAVDAGVGERGGDGEPCCGQGDNSASSAPVIAGAAGESRSCAGLFGDPDA